MSTDGQRWRNLLIPFIVITVDRITKYFALAHCRGGCSLNSFLSLDLTFNRGISWGIFNHTTNAAFLAVTTLVLIITIGLVAYTIRCWHAGAPIWAELLVLGGSFSNLFDRFFHGGVVDFILISYGNYSWPMFNFADICIVLGVGAMVFDVYKREWNKS